MNNGRHLKEGESTNDNLVEEEDEDEEADEDEELLESEG